MGDSIKSGIEAAALKKIEDEGFVKKGGGALKRKHELQETEEPLSPKRQKPPKEKEREGTTTMEDEFKEDLERDERERVASSK